MDVRLSTGILNTAKLSAARSDNRVVVPVRPLQSPYAQYKHVRGVPASSSERAVPLSKLRVLNNIIDSLQMVKSNRQQMAPKAKEGLSDEAINAMIEQFSQQLHQAIKQTAPTFTPLGSGTGMAFNVSV